MPKQQTKRRRKGYQQASAYAGNVKPTGVLGFLSSATLIKGVFIFMGLALAAGGGVAIFGSNVLTSSSNPRSFVSPDDDDAQAVATPAPNIEVRQYSGAPAMGIDPGREYTAVISTDIGDIEVDLFASEVPETVNNFTFLADDGFYDGLVFYYVEPGFSAQAGDPACQSGGGDACRGTGGPGYDLEQEANGQFTKGTIGMINGSQFFIVLSESSTESERFTEYTPFGQILSGLEVADTITEATVIRSIEIR